MACSFLFRKSKIFTLMAYFLIHLVARIVSPAFQFCLRTYRRISAAFFSTALGRPSQTKSSNCHVVAVARRPIHGNIDKQHQQSIKVITNQGVEGDCHRDEQGKSLRQVSLLGDESLDHLNRLGNSDDRILPGELGENITTRNVKLADLKKGTKLHFVAAEGGNDAAVISITGLRSASHRLEERQNGLEKRCTVKNASGIVVGSEVGVFGVVDVGGVIEPGMIIEVEEPTGDLKTLNFL